MTSPSNVTAELPWSSADMTSPSNVAAELPWPNMDVASPSHVEQQISVEDQAGQNGEVESHEHYEAVPPCVTVAVPMPGMMWPMMPGQMPPANWFMGGMNYAGVGTFEDYAPNSLYKQRKSRRKAKSLVTAAQEMKQWQQELQLKARLQQLQMVQQAKMQQILEQNKAMNQQGKQGPSEQDKPVAPAKPSESKEPKQHAARFCPYCGKGIQGHFKFCRFCGASTAATFAAYEKCAST